MNRPLPRASWAASSSSDVLELAGARLREIRAILQAIDEGELLSDLPASAASRLRHQTAVSMLAIADRELMAAIIELDQAPGLGA
jgi:hypothetical protein